MRAIDGAQAAELQVDGRRVDNFSSNNYLGLADSPILRDAATRAMLEHGFGAGASRLIVGNLALHASSRRARPLERAPRRRCSSPPATRPTSASSPRWSGPSDDVFSDALNHASIIDGCRLSRARVRRLSARATSTRSRACSRATPRPAGA